MKKIEPYLQHKRDEIIWALSDPHTQGHTGSQIARIFNLSKATIHDILKNKPVDFKTKWIKKN